MSDAKEECPGLRDRAGGGELFQLGTGEEPEEGRTSCTQCPKGTSQDRHRSAPGRPLPLHPPFSTSGTVSSSSEPRGSPCTPSSLNTPRPPTSRLFSPSRLHQPRVLHPGPGRPGYTWSVARSPNEPPRSCLGPLARSLGSGNAEMSPATGEEAFVAFSLPVPAEGRGSGDGLQGLPLTG